MLRLLTGAIAIGTLFLLACASEGNSSSGSASSADVKHGKEVYRKYCVLCHGEDGKKAVNGAYDITVSEMTLVQRTELITNGRNLMTPFAGILTEEEIRDVAAYSMKLGQQ
jgi:mono/diheme cytochrome c family protein